jgi:hypothetical protein
MFAGASCGKKLPFLPIFKAHFLSESWRAWFASIESHEDEIKRRDATSFQNLVEESSRKWKKCCPVVFSGEGVLVT